MTKEFRNALELGEFLQQYFEGPFFSYGSAHELVMREEATNKSILTEDDFVTIPAIKPRFFFRGADQGLRLAVAYPISGLRAAQQI